MALIKPWRIFLRNDLINNSPPCWKKKVVHLTSRAIYQVITKSLQCAERTYELVSTLRPKLLLPLLPCLIAFLVGLADNLTATSILIVQNKDTPDLQLIDHTNLYLLLWW
jgi:hypothetical protein